MKASTLQRVDHTPSLPYPLWGEQGQARTASAFRRTRRGFPCNGLPRRTKYTSITKITCTHKHIHTQVTYGHTHPGILKVKGKALSCTGAEPSSGLRAHLLVFSISRGIISNLEAM